MAMFVDLKHILDGLDSKDDGEVNGDEEVFNIGLIKTIDKGVHLMNEVEAFNEQGSSIALLEGALIHLNHTMQQSIEECTQGGVALFDHATSIMKVMASKIWNNSLTKVNELLHSWMSSHHVDDGLGYLIRRLKDLHETMFTHTNAHKKKNHY